MPKILLVDDDVILLRLLYPILKQRGFEVVTSHSGIEALRAAYQAQPDLILLDIALPDVNGIEVCQQLRKVTDASIIMLSAQTQEQTIVEALDTGADDYITKPYSVNTLVARIRAQLRIQVNRNRTATPKEKTILTAGEVSINTTRRQVHVRGEKVKLTPTEYKILLHFVRNPNRVVTYEELLTTVWGSGHKNQLHYVRFYILYLRQKIEEDPSRPRIIRTKHGIGYYLGKG